MSKFKVTTEQFHMAIRRFAPKEVTDVKFVSVRADTLMLIVVDGKVRQGYVGGGYLKDMTSPELLQAAVKQNWKQFGYDA